MVGLNGLRVTADDFGPCRRADAMGRVAPRADAVPGLQGCWLRSRPGVSKKAEREDFVEALLKPVHDALN